MKYPEKLRVYKARKKIKYEEIALFVGVTIQAVKNWCSDTRCPKGGIRREYAEKLVEFSNGYFTLKDFGYAD